MTLLTINRVQVKGALIMPTFELIHSEPQENKNGNFITAKYDHGKDIITLMICTDVVTLGLVSTKLLQEFKNMSEDMDPTQRGALCKILCEEHSDEKN